MGAALAEVQCFEYVVAHALALIMSPRSQDGGLTAEFETQLSQKFDCTLGRLIVILKKHAGQSESAKTLETALKQRNRFIHGFLGKYGWPVMEDSLYIEAIRELQKIRSDIANGARAASQVLADQALHDVIVIELDRNTGNWQEMITG